MKTRILITGSGSTLLMESHDWSGQLPMNNGETPTEALERSNAEDRLHIERIQRRIERHERVIQHLKEQ